MQVKFTRTEGTKQRRIIIDNKVIGTINRINKNGQYMAHWTGEIVVNGETWRINEQNLNGVITRIAEAYKI